MAEEFRLTEDNGATVLEYAGELGTDFGAAGQWWATRVAAYWEAAVRSFDGIKDEAERRSAPPARSLARPEAAAWVARWVNQH